MKSQRGAQRKRLALERGECERFGRNLAVLAGIVPATVDGGAGVSQQCEGAGASSSSGEMGIRGKWAALRTFVEGSLR